MVYTSATLSYFDCTSFLGGIL
uniref:Uncharacterized protein n=1 Tax=Anguilla anguilla TaxID=7936 RepID=A0A0E9VY95_ANGAN